MGRGEQPPNGDRASALQDESALRAGGDGGTTRDCAQGHGAVTVPKVTELYTCSRSLGCTHTSGPHGKLYDVSIYHKCAIYLQMFGDFPVAFLLSI